MPHRAGNHNVWVSCSRLRLSVKHIAIGQKYAAANKTGNLDQRDRYGPELPWPTERPEFVLNDEQFVQDNVSNHDRTGEAERSRSVQQPLPRGE